MFIKVSRILQPLRELDRDSKHQTVDSPRIEVPVEISSGLCDADEPIVREILRGTPMMSLIHI